MANKVTCPKPEKFVKLAALHRAGVADGQTRAYEEAMGHEWSGPYSLQFDYTGHARRGDTKRAQILRLTGI